MAEDFNTNRYHGGGRFDSTKDDQYPYLYAAHEQATAIAETFLRNVPFPNRGARTVPRAALRGRRLSRIELAVDLTLLRLISATDLAAVRQDQWLVDADTDADYVQTRHCGHWMRSIAPWAQGLIWQSKRNQPEHVLILFGDRCDLLSVSSDEPLSSIDLDDEIGADWLKTILAPYGATVQRPRR